MVREVGKCSCFLSIATQIRPEKIWAKPKLGCTGNGAPDKQQARATQVQARPAPRRKEDKEGGEVRTNRQKAKSKTKGAQIAKPGLIPAQPLPKRQPYQTKTKTTITAAVISRQDQQARNKEHARERTNKNEPRGRERPQKTK